MVKSQKNLSEELFLGVHTRAERREEAGNISAHPAVAQEGRISIIHSTVNN